MDSIPPLKHCVKCNLPKPLTDFYKYSGRRCKHCVNEKIRAWRAANPDLAKKYSRNWKKNHKEENFKLQMKWRKTPNGKQYALCRRIKNGDVTTKQLSELLDRQKRCAYCKKKFTDKLPATVDHVIPLAKGGLHTISNLVLACKPCNCKKSDSLIRLL